MNNKKHKGSSSKGLTYCGGNRFCFEGDLTFLKGSKLNFEDGAEGGSGGVSPEEVTTIVKEQFPGGVGYEEMVKTDTLTWNGVDGVPLYLASTKAPTYEQMQQQGGSLSAVNEKGETLTSELGGTNAKLVVENDSLISIRSYGGYVTFLYIALTDNVVFYERTFEKAGVYFVRDGLSYATSFTVNGFEFEVKSLSTIDTKYLPEYLQFGEDKAFEPITWDGNTEGLASITVTTDIMGELQFYKVKDEYIRIADAAAVESCSLYANNGGSVMTQEITPEMAEQMGVSLATVTEHGFAVAGGYVVVSDGSFLLPGSSTDIPYGVWFAKFYPEDDYVAYVTSVKPTTTIKPIPAEYLPKAAAVADVTEAPTAEQFNALLAALRAAGYLEQ